jgi:hypothetical protein
MKKFVITEQDRKHILSRYGLLNEQAPEEIKQGSAGDPYQYKKVGNKFWYAFKGNNPNWIQSKILKGVNAISQNIFKGLEIAKDQAELDKLYDETGTQSNVTTTTPKSDFTCVTNLKNDEIVTITNTSGEKIEDNVEVIDMTMKGTGGLEYQIGEIVFKPNGTYVDLNKPNNVLNYTCSVGVIKTSNHGNIQKNDVTTQAVQGNTSGTGAGSGLSGAGSAGAGSAAGGGASSITNTTTSSQVKGQSGQVTDKFGTRPLDISGIQNTQTTTQQGKDTLSNQPTQQTNTTQQPVQYGIKDIKDILKQKGFKVGSDENKLGKMTLTAIEKALSKQ